MEAIECILTRKSVRRYSPGNLREKDIETILECGLSAPSASNRRPVEFFVVRNRKKLEELGEMCTYGKFIKEAACCIVVLGNEQHSKRFVEDGCAATENILLAAHALGHGACWVAGWRTEYEQGVLNALGIPKENPDLKLVSLISIGLKSREYEPSPRPRKTVEEVVHFID
jgi:nitroreductase